MATTVESTKPQKKSAFDKAWALIDKLGGPVNRFSNKLGCEAFWPMTLDKENEKAARILRSFCKEGFHGHGPAAMSDALNTHPDSLLKIPPEVIRKAKGLAIFTTMRTGMQISGSGGSGVLIARLPDGSWSPPSGIFPNTIGAGFCVGADIYDCVIVINTEEALQAFSRVRCTVGGEVSAVAGPYGVGAIVESEVHKRQAPVLTYMKSRGFYAGLQVDGTVIIERSDENERFYGEKIRVHDILAGKAQNPPVEAIMPLWQAIRMAEGYTSHPQPTGVWWDVPAKADMNGTAVKCP